MKIRNCLPVLTLLLVSACASAPQHALNAGGMSDSAFLKASAAERQKELDRISSGAMTLMELQRTRYMAGVPVYVGDKRTGSTIHRDPITGMVSVYPGHDPHGIDGAISSGMYVTFSDPYGNLIFNRGPNGEIAPIAALANVATQDDVWRDVVRGFFSVATGASNNLGAAFVAKSAACKGNCSAPGNVVINEQVALPIAEAAAVSAAETVVKTTIAPAKQPVPLSKMPGM